MSTPVGWTRQDKGTGRVSSDLAAVASARSGGEAVLVQQPAETVNSLDSAPTFEVLQGQEGNRRLEGYAAVRQLGSGLAE